MADNMKGLSRTHYCGEVEGIGNEVTVGGFTQRIRDKGGLIFIDLRDRTGIVQLVFDDTTDKAVFEKAKTVRSEYVLMAKGLLRKRESVNTEIKTGDVEILVSDLRILSKAQTPPFEIVNDTKVNDELRLKYRYLDLRRKKLQDNIIMRHKIAKIAREYFYDNGFLEIETPMMIKSTPEGARDYLVPSRIHEGKFYALPQSPQIYKQLLMISGFDRYIQLARCFRDEDLRADRQPEFTQIDLEMSFVDVDDILAVAEGFIKKLMKETLDIDIPTPLPRLSYNDAMNRYGSDKPDTRFGMEITDISDIVKDCGFGVFRDPIAAGGSVRLSFSDRVYISRADREASLNFSTPDESDHSIVLELLIHEKLVLRSGALTPGSTLKSLLLLDGVRLQPGGYDGVFRVSFYDPHTGAMARVDAEIPVKVTVTES